jgi:aryl-alcohol dehydrogenase-like predicted oxidoreductase
MVLGTLPFGSVLDVEASNLIISEAWELGIRAFDVAGLYGNGLAAEILGKSFKKKSERPVFCCSIGLEQVADKNGVFSVDVVPLSRSNVIKSVDQLLSKLLSEKIDVLNIHAPDISTPLEETLAALKDLKQLGKINQISYSNVTPEYLNSIQVASLDLDLKIDRIQFHGNLLEQKLILEFSSKRYEKLDLFCYRPLARGLLTRGYSQENLKPENSRASRGWRLNTYLTPEIIKHLERFDQLSKKIDVPKVQLSLAWLFEIARVHGVVFGVRTLNQLHEIYPYWSTRITNEQISEIHAFANDPEFDTLAKGLPLVHFEK